METKIVLSAVAILGFAAIAYGAYIEDEIQAYHFHTYIFDVNPNHVAEALALRRRTRELINDGTFAECSLNAIYLGWDGPHPFSQYELCCNKTSFAVANSFHMQNHGNLSVLIHPLTIYDQEDHIGSVSWLGQPVPLDTECPCLYPELPKPRPCPVYEDSPDELPTDNIRPFLPPPGTEDYRNITGLNLKYAKY